MGEVPPESAPAPKPSFRMAAVQVLDSILAVDGEGGKRSSHRCPYRMSPVARECLQHLRTTRGGMPPARTRAKGIPLDEETRRIRILPMGMRILRVSLGGVLPLWPRRGTGSDTLGAMLSMKDWPRGRIRGSRAIPYDSPVFRNSHPH